MSTDQQLLELGSDLWIYLDSHQGEMTKGKLIHQFWHNNKYIYVIEIDSAVDPIHECRDWWTISTDGEEINMWR